MIMKITNQELVSSFIPQLKEILVLKTNAKVAYNTAKTSKSIYTAGEVYETARKAVLDTRCEMENGKPKIHLKEYVFATPELKLEAIALVEQLAKQEVEIEIYPIKLSDLDDALAIIPIIDKTTNKETGVNYVKACVSAITLLSLKDFIQEN